MMLVGLLVGLTIPLAPFPRLMLSAHISFLLSGLLSVIAGLLIKTSMAQVCDRAGTVIVVAHVSNWALAVSAVAGACWGATKALPLAGAQAGAPGAAAWQETVVFLCHAVPSVILIVAWILLVHGICKACCQESATGH